MATEEPITTGTSLSSQLSDAIASFLYTSFDDVAKNLVTRLQAPEAKPIQRTEIQELKPPPPPSQEPEPDPEPLFNVPYARNPDFVGRSAHLSRLFEMWRPSQKGRIAIVGLGGIG